MTGSVKEYDMGEVERVGRMEKKSGSPSRCVLFLMIAAGAILLFAGCGKKEEKAQEEKAVNVRVALAEKKPLRPFVETVGTLKPNEEVVVSSEIDGILKRITVVEGAKVDAGSLIAEIKDTDYVLAVKQAEATLRQAQATLANAKQEFGRKEALYKEQLVTQQQFDDIAARREVATCDVDRALSALDLAKERLTKTKIYAPLGCSVKEKRVAAGDYVKNGTPLVALIQTDPLKLNFTVIEKDVGKLRAGQDVSFFVDSFPDRLFQGKVKNIYANMDEKSRSLQVEALVANPRDALKAGLFARVVLYTGEARDKITVPITALLYEGSDIKAFVVENGRAAERAVKTGQKFGELMEIVEGLQGGEQLVVVGQNNLARGVKINVAR